MAMKLWLIDVIHAIDICFSILFVMGIVQWVFTIFLKISINGKILVAPTGYTYWLLLIGGLGVVFWPSKVVVSKLLGM